MGAAGWDQEVMIRSFDFLRDKYGTELLVDIGWVHELESFILTDEPHRLEFYDILLLTAGEGAFQLDDRVYRVAPATVLFTSPGQARRWVGARGVDGLCLFFPGEFLEEFFNDPLFLQRLQFFHRHRAGLSLELEEGQARWLGERLERMRGELAALRGDSAHLLRAILYEVLITLNRWYAAAHSSAADTETSPVVFRFLQLIEQHHRTDHRVAAYSRWLGITSGHLNELSKQYLGQSASAVIRSRLVVEAKRLLLYSDQTASQAGYELGFEDPSYFGRFFKRYVGSSPSRYRDRAER